MSMEYRVIRQGDRTYRCEQGSSSGTHWHTLSKHFYTLFFARRYVNHLLRVQRRRYIAAQRSEEVVYSTGQQ